MNDQIIKPVGYNSLEERKLTGSHYTPKILADFVAKQIVKALPDPSPQRWLRILDPAVGDGELLMSMMNELTKINFSNTELLGFDTDLNAVAFANSKLKDSYPDESITISNKDFLEFSFGYSERDLFNNVSFEPIDIVIANPPYVRTQVMGAKKSQQLAQQFNLTGRVDLYHAFIQGISEIMRPGGILGIIVSNRFMTTRAGKSVRKSLIQKFNIIHVWDLGDTKLFEAAVLPAVLIAQRKDGVTSRCDARFSSIYSTDKNIPPSKHYPDAISTLDTEGLVKLENGQSFNIVHGKLDYNGKLGDVWRVSTAEADNWLSTVNENTFCQFGDIGKVRVGVKTTADKVFIRSDWHTMSKSEIPELLMPVMTHHVARRYKAIQPENPRFILYTHEVVNGTRKAIKLEEYPKSAKYLLKFKDKLESRKYVIDSGRNWFEIWVPQNPETWSKPKLVFRDIVEKPTFWIDLRGSVVNGDCYWLSSYPKSDPDILWLALAVGNSTFIELFYDRKYHNKLYSGRRRFMTQYVETFPIPDPENDLSIDIIDITKEIYKNIPSVDVTELETELDRLVWKAFGLSIEEVNR